MENKLKKEDINNDFITGWKKSYDGYDENVYFNNLNQLNYLNEVEFIYEILRKRKKIPINGKEKVLP